MLRLQRPISILLITLGASQFGTERAVAESDLDVTMTVFESIADIDEDLLVDAPLAEERYEEDLFDLDNDGIPDDEEDETGLFRQYHDPAADFEIADENDGFERDNEAGRAWHEFATEDDFEEGEKLDEDAYDILETPDAPTGDPA